MTLSTKTDLVELLVKEQMIKRSANVAYVIKRARSGKYHDWDSDLDAPKAVLINDLSAIKTFDTTSLVFRVKRGDFDEDPTNEQLSLLRSDIGEEEFDRLFHKKR